MSDTLLAIAIITVVVIVIAYIWDDLTEEIRLNMEPDLTPPIRPVRSHGQRSLIMSLCLIGDDGFTTPRGVTIPAEDLMGDLDLGDALDYLEYVEALG